MTLTLTLTFHLTVKPLACVISRLLLVACWNWQHLVDRGRVVHHDPLTVAKEQRHEVRATDFRRARGRSRHGQSLRRRWRQPGWRDWWRLIRFRAGRLPNFVVAEASSTTLTRSSARRPTVVVRAAILAQPTAQSINHVRNYRWSPRRGRLSNGRSYWLAG